MTNATGNVEPRPLDGRVIGVSVSESEDLAEWGYTIADVNRTTVRLSEAFLAAGARLVFGHDWRPDGVMDAICRLAVKYQPSDSRITEPLIHNLLPWPTEPAMNAELRRDLEQRRVLKVEMVAIPKCDWQSPADPLARAIALSHLRRELARHADARVCLGGRTGRGPGATPLGGFFAGVIEEAYDSAVTGKPVYAASFLGGAAARLASFLREPAQRGPVREVLEVLPARAEQLGDVAESAPGLTPPRDLAEGFDPERLQKLSGLASDEWQDLLNALDIEAFATLVIRGLARLPRAPRPAAAATVPSGASSPPASPPKRRRRTRPDAR